MKVGDIIINPYVPKMFNGELNPNYATIFLGKSHNGNLRFMDYHGKQSEWVMPSERPFEVVGHIDFYAVITKYIESFEEGDTDGT